MRWGGLRAAAAPPLLTIPLAPICSPFLPPQFPNPYMAPLSSGVATQQEYGSSWVLKEAALEGLGAAGLAAAQVVIESCAMAGLHFHRDANEVVFQVTGAWGCAGGAAAAARARVGLRCRRPANPCAPPPFGYRPQALKTTRCSSMAR